MYLDEIETFLAGRQGKSKRVSPFGCLVGYLDSKAFLPDAGDFSNFMCDVFEWNQLSATINELEIKVPGYSAATSLFLIEQEKSLYKAVRDLGCEAIGFSKENEFYGRTSVVLRLPVKQTISVYEGGDEEYRMLLRILSGVIKNARRQKSFIHIGTSFGWHFESFIDELDGLDSSGESGIVFAGRTVRCRNPWPKSNGSQ